MRGQGPHRVTVLGGFGFDNLGDDLILRAALAQMKSTLRNVEISILSSNPFETAARHKGEGVIFSAEALLRQFVLRFLSRASAAHRKHVLPVPPESFRRLVASLQESDLVASLGGGYLNDYSNFLTHIRLMELVFIGLFRKSMILYAHEVGPLQRNSLRTLAKLALKFVTYATVRDMRSVQVLVDLGFSKERILLTADESWAYSPKIQSKSGSSIEEKTDGLVVAVNLMPAQVAVNLSRFTSGTRLNVTETNNQIIYGMASWLTSLGVRLRRIFFLSMSSKDTPLALRLQAMLGARISMEVCTDLDSQLNALSQSDLLVAMRMHTVIMAAQMNVPPVAIALLSKVRDAMDNLGLSEYTVEATPFNASEAQNVFNRALQDANAIRRLMRTRVEDLKQRARLNARTALGALKNR